MSEQKNRFTYRGTIHELGPVQKFSTGFKKLELVCKTVGEKYTDYAVFTAKNDACDRVITLRTGDEVAVDFVLDGREWEGPKGKRWFGGAIAIKVERIGGADAPTAESEGCYADAQADDNDMPF